MDKKIPKVFANKVDKKAGNNEKVFYSEQELDQPESLANNKYDRNINQKINDIFNSPNYIYKADVEIKLRDKTISKRIIGKNSTHLITMENELIPISDIIDIYRK